MRHEALHTQPHYHLCDEEDHWRWLGLQQQQQQQRVRSHSDLCGCDGDGAGYVTEVYSEERMLVFMDEDDYQFIGGDLLVLST